MVEEEEEEEARVEPRSPDEASGEEGTKMTIIVILIICKGTHAGRRKERLGA